MPAYEIKRVLMIPSPPGVRCHGAPAGDIGMYIIISALVYKLTRVSDSVSILIFIYIDKLAYRYMAL